MHESLPATFVPLRPEIAALQDWPARVWNQQESPGAHAAPLALVWQERPPVSTGPAAAEQREPAQGRQYGVSVCSTRGQNFTSEPQGAWRGSQKRSSGVRVWPSVTVPEVPFACGGDEAQHSLERCTASPAWGEAPEEGSCLAHGQASPQSVQTRQKPAGVPPGLSSHCRAACKARAEDIGPTGTNPCHPPLRGTRAESKQAPTPEEGAEALLAPGVPICHLPQSSSSRWGAGGSPPPKQAVARGAEAQVPPPEAGGGALSQGWASQGACPAGRAWRPCPGCPWCAPRTRRGSAGAAAAGTGWPAGCGRGGPPGGRSGG